MLTTEPPGKSLTFSFNLIDVVSFACNKIHTLLRVQINEFGQIHATASPNKRFLFSWKIPWSPSLSMLTPTDNQEITDLIDVIIVLPVLEFHIGASQVA